jgi:membrane protease YdiL (CAAX protease family)
MVRGHRGLVAFLALTFGITWAGMLFTRFVLHVSLAAIPGQWFAMTPALVAVVVRRWITREGFGDAGLRLRLRAAWPYYLVAWLGPFALAGAAVGLLWLCGLARLDAATLGLALPGLPWWGLLPVLAGLIVAMAPAYWGEEFGWTSYLRLRILPGRPLAATLVTASILAVWHYPLAFLGYADFSNVWIGLLLWTPTFFSLEVITSWLRLRSGSIWTASLGHAGNNMVLWLLVGLTTDHLGRHHDMLVMAIADVPLAVAAGLVLATGRYRGVTEVPRQDHHQLSTTLGL